MKERFAKALEGLFSEDELDSSSGLVQVLWEDEEQIKQATNRLIAAKVCFEVYYCSDGYVEITASE